MYAVLLVDLMLVVDDEGIGMKLNVFQVNQES